MIKRVLITPVQFVRKVWWFLSRPVTKGVKAVVISPEGKIILIRNSYQKAWYLPGGGVKKGESEIQAIERELKEEIGLESSSEIIKLADYDNSAEYKTDTVTLFIVENAIMRKSRSIEIEEVGKFNLDDLPDKTSPATLRRITDWKSSSKIGGRW